MKITDPVLLAEYEITFTDRDVQKHGLSDEKKHELFEYMRLYGAEEKHFINKKTGVGMWQYKTKLPGYLIEQLTGTSLRSNKALYGSLPARDADCNH